MLYALCGLVVLALSLLRSFCAPISLALSLSLFTGMRAGYQHKMLFFMSVRVSFVCFTGSALLCYVFFTSATFFLELQTRFN